MKHRWTTFVLYISLAMPPKITYHDDVKILGEPHTGRVRGIIKQALDEGVIDKVVTQEWKHLTHLVIAKAT